MDRKDFAIPEPLVSDAPVRLSVQMLAVGANLFVERDDVSTLIGRMDYVQNFDLRCKAWMRRVEFCVHGSIAAGQSIYIEEATAALSLGIGQSDRWIGSITRSWAVRDDLQNICPSYFVCSSYPIRHRQLVDCLAQHRINVGIHLICQSRTGMLQQPLSDSR